VPALLAFPAGRLAAGLLALAAALVVAGLVLLWPSGDGAPPATGPSAGEAVAAEVVSVSAAGCEREAGPGCRRVVIRLEDGRRSFLTLPGDPLAPRLQPGDAIRVAPNAPDPGIAPYAFQDFRRTAPLGWLALAFALLVVAFARWQGLRSLVGLGLALVLVVEFLVPAVLDGRPPLLVAMVGGLAITLLTTAFTHGLGLKTAAALLGLTAALLLTAVLALLAADLAQLTGLASELALTVALTAEARLSLGGLVVAGIVIGALGVLDDVAVSQASTVLALRRASPGFDARRLYRAAMGVGRDHLAATVNTLVLAYVGAALPVLLVFANQGTALTEALNREPVAEAVVAALVGSLGLIAAVPLATGLAALLATRLPPERLPAEVPGHVH